MPAYKFTGRAGAFVTGVPAHDLSEDDYAALTDEQRALLVANAKGPQPIYELVKAEAKKAKKGESANG